MERVSFFVAWERGGKGEGQKGREKGGQEGRGRMEGGGRGDTGQGLTLRF